RARRPAPRGSSSPPLCRRRTLPRPAPTAARAAAAPAGRPDGCAPPRAPAAPGGRPPTPHEFRPCARSSAFLLFSLACLLLARRGLGDALDRREPRIPFGRDLRQRARRGVKPLRTDRIAHLAPTPPALHEPGAVEDGQVLGHRLPRDGQLAGDDGGGRLPP